MNPPCNRPPSQLSSYMKGMQAGVTAPPPQVDVTVPNSLRLV